MSKLIMQQILSGTTPGIQPVINQQAQQHKNPFLRAHNGSEASNNDYGVNKPLRQPMFVGYRDNQAVYAGSRLFVLY